MRKDLPQDTMNSDDQAKDERHKVWRDLNPVIAGIEVCAALWRDYIRHPPAITNAPSAPTSTNPLSSMSI